MRKLIFFVVAVLAGVGFYRLSTKDRQQVLDTGQNAAEAAGRVVAGGYRAVVDYAKGLNPESPTEKLEKSKTELERAKRDAESQGASTSTLGNLNDQLARVQSALDVQRLQKQLDEKVKAAKEAKENADKSVDDVKKTLASVDSGYQSLMSKLDGAKKAYADAEKRFSRSN